MITAKVLKFVVLKIQALCFGQGWDKIINFPSISSEIMPGQYLLLETKEGACPTSTRSSHWIV